jgi:GAF domain-containing protein
MAEEDANVYHNSVIGATPNPVMLHPDAIDAEFAEAANAVLSNAVELVRHLIGAHQGAVAIVVQGDWRSIRKFFSLSAKYAAWADYQTPATGYGIHGWLLSQKRTVRLTEAELEAHPEYKRFGVEGGKHPPMRGWLATPLLDSQGVCWGLMQLSDKYAGDFTAEDEATFGAFAHLVASHLEALWQVHDLRKAQAGS